MSSAAAAANETGSHPLSNIWPNASREAAATDYSALHIRFRAISSYPSQPSPLLCIYLFIFCFPAHPTKPSKVSIECCCYLRLHMWCPMVRGKITQVHVNNFGKWNQAEDSPIFEYMLIGNRQLLYCPTAQTHTHTNKEHENRYGRSLWLVKQK